MLSAAVLYAYVFLLPGRLSAPYPLGREDDVPGFERKAQAEESKGHHHRRAHPALSSLPFPKRTRCRPPPCTRTRQRTAHGANLPQLDQYGDPDHRPSSGRDLERALPRDGQKPIQLEKREQNPWRRLASLPSGEVVVAYVETALFGSWPLSQRLPGSAGFTHGKRLFRPGGGGGGTDSTKGKLLPPSFSWARLPAAAG